jgi:hypothetical protein
LISSDVTKLKFQLPQETYTFNTAMWGNLPSGTVPTVPCTTTDQCCALADCSTTPLVCESGACAANLPESLVEPVNLSQDMDLQKDRSLADLSIDSITYTIANNSLNVDLPALTIYMAPQTVTDPNSPQAIKFGTVPVIPAGTDPSGMVQLEANAAQTFQMFTADLSVPFNLIASTTVDIPAGTPIPSGQITMTVSGVIAAQPNL